MMKDVNPWAWPVEVFMQHGAETESMVATCGSEKLIEAIASEVDLVNAAAIQPVNATIAYDEALVFGMQRSSRRWRALPLI